MNLARLLGFFFVLMLVSLVGQCLAEDTPRYLLYLQGSESSITNESDGITDITVKDIVPYFQVSDEKESLLIPVERLVERLPNLTGPSPAAVLFSGSDGESVSLVTISNISLYDENKVLRLRVHPIEFYEGTILSSFASEKNDLDKIPVDSIDSTGIYLEMTGQTPQNWDGFCVANHMC